MKILQILPRFPWPIKDGGALAFYSHLQGLNDNHHQVVSAVLNTSKHHVDWETLPEKVKNLANFTLFEIENSITIKGAIFNLFKDESYILSRFYVKEFEAVLGGLIQAHAPDLVLFESLQTARYLPFVRSQTASVCLLRSHNIEFNIWLEQAKIEKNIFKAAFVKNQAIKLRKEELSLSASFDGILAITKEDAANYAALTVKTPTLYYPVGFYPRTSELLPIKHQSKVFHLGSMDWMPNQAAVRYFLEEIWPLVQTENKELCFEIAGRNMPDSFLKLNQKGVKVIGEIENSDSYMQQNGLLVIPLLSGSGMRVKVMEGMALGKCIISSSKGMEGIEAVAGKHFILANTPEEFKRAILYYTTNLTEADKIGEEARKFALTAFQNQQIVAQLEGFALSVIKLKDGLD
jgi:polysaccharide biosynthesis protein PslH